MTSTDWPRIDPGSPAFKSGTHVAPDGTVTLQPDEFWDVETPGAAATAKAPLPAAAHIVQVVGVGPEATAVAEYEPAPGHVLTYTKTVPIDRVRWVTSDRYSFSHAAKDRADARQAHIDGGK